MATVKENAAEIERLAGEIDALRDDLRATAGVLHGLVTLLMQNRVAPALTAHKAKWKALLLKLDAIQEDTHAENTEEQDQAGS